MITVISRTTFPPSFIDRMEDLTQKSIPIFARSKGFISMEVKKDLNDGGTLTIFKWKTIEDHENCMADQDAWGALDDAWKEFIDDEEVDFNIIFIGNDWKDSNGL